MDVFQVVIVYLDDAVKTVAERLGVQHEKLLSAGIAVLFPLATIFVLNFIFSQTSKSRSANGKNNYQSKNSAGPVKSIWDFNRSNRASSTAKSKAEATGKPFVSTYYYAHNNPNATGGYKDGLRMEDYTMNQPRLLSRDGKPVDDAAPTEEELELPNDTSQQEQQPPVQKPNNAKATNEPDVRLITKYQWDDPGELNGIAHIRIDTLPGRDGADIKWQDIQVRDISARLIEKNGLEIKVQTESGETYLLKVPTLYGQAAAVRAFVKPKRLVVRLWKVKSMLTVLDYGTSNLKPWPCLRKL